jgi:tyrosyl-tRNA synthetase
MNIFEQLRIRNLIQDTSDSDLENSLPKSSYFYVGFDPSAKSLHLGNLIPLFTAIRLAQNGYKPIILFGGATGAIGDPSGKNAERQLLDRAVIDHNVLMISSQVRKIASRLNVELEFVDNYSWTKDISILDFLRDTGKYFTINYLLDKEMIRNRLAGDGISYTEFSYMLLQAFDFLHLYQHKNCILQIGGSDQWGNITAGLELIRKKIQGSAFAFSIPLLTRSNGQKFGKSESGAIMLDPELTSPYQFHQYILNLTDEDAIKLLKALSFIDIHEIKKLEEEIRLKPEERNAQKILADHLCDLVHGNESTTNAKASAKVLFGGSIENISDNELLNIFSNVPSSNLLKSHVNESKIIDIFVSSALCNSKSEVRKLVKNGGAYINNIRIEDPEASLINFNVTNRSVIILRSGKKNYHLVRLV